MTKVWPKFVTKDLGNTDEDTVEMQRRWEVYDREMRALISKGGVYLDEDGWWIDEASGELIGPDPELERPRFDDNDTEAKSFDEVFPDLAEKARRGRPPSDNPKVAVSIRLDQDVVEAFKKEGPGWQTRMNDILKAAAHLN